MTTKKSQSQNAGSATIDNIAISNRDDPSRIAIIAGGFIEFRYWESILQDSIKASYSFVDSGNSIDKKTVAEGLPLQGSEQFLFEATDNNDTKLKIDMMTKKSILLDEQTGKSVVILPLVSPSHPLNDSQNVRKRFDGKISDHAKAIIEDFLQREGVDKELDIEETSNTISEFGYSRTPYYMLNNFAKKAVPNGGQGRTAGYFFFETSKKFIFKSIDSMFDKEKNEPKRSIIYNESSDREKEIPAGYDYKALTYSKEGGDVMEMAKMGAFQTAQITFNSYDFSFKHNILSNLDDLVSSQNSIKPLSSSGKDLVSFNSTLVKEFGRTTISFFDTGTFSRELEKSSQVNFDISEIMNQSIMRYNQVFASKVHITIQGDFSLHAGDMVFFDAPSPQSDTKNDKVDKQTGGLYIIASLCHYIKPDRTLTKLCLVRDSSGRTGNHTKR